MRRVARLDRMEAVAAGHRLFLHIPQLAAVAAVEDGARAMALLALMAAAALETSQVARQLMKTAMPAAMALRTPVVAAAVPVVPERMGERAAETMAATAVRLSRTISPANLSAMARAAVDAPSTAFLVREAAADALMATVTPTKARTFRPRRERTELEEAEVQAMGTGRLRAERAERAL